MLLGVLAAFALAAWLWVLLSPAGAWRTPERLIVRSDAAAGAGDLGTITILIPARNESDAIGRVLAALARQGRGVRVILIDDQSTDGTGEAARAQNALLSAPLDLRVVDGRDLPAGWGGKLWALEQGFEQVDTPYCLLLDAEIELAPGTLSALLQKMSREDLGMASVMAKLRCSSFWERLLVPPFIYFFKLIYPFARVNDRGSRIAAAAGGCILIRSDALREVGGFRAFSDALIDDCTLAARVKEAGFGIWLGLSDAVSSLRAYESFSDFRRMVTRTAFTQLRYSILWLVLVVVSMVCVFIVPVYALLAAPGPVTRWIAFVALIAMASTYLPTVKFYRLSTIWTLTLPVAATLFLAMTVESAIKYWRGIKAEWKGRRYSTRA